MLSLSLRQSSARLPAARRNSPAHVTLRRPVVHARRLEVRAAAEAPSSSSSSSSSSSAPVAQLTDELRLLETERDEAVKTGEECARKVVKLEEMVRLLEQLAVNKLSEGDEDGARRVLQEKASVQDMLSKTSTRATTNFTLASKLAEKIGQQQAEIMNLLSPTRSSSTSGQTTSSTPSSSSSTSSSGLYSYSRSKSDSNLSSGSSYAPASQPRSSSSTAPPSSRQYSGADASSSSDSDSSSGGGGHEAPWEKSLRDARQRVAEVEAQAYSAGQAAGYKARESIEEARERLRQQAVESVTAARSRIRLSASESIAEAQARIAAEDAAALAEVHKVIDRYKSGGYVSEAELDWAFAQLERRSWRG